MYREYDDKTLKKLHQVELEILDEFVRICDKYKLNYSLMAGTMLGAVRHAGFIPWDDDIDVCMLRSDYEKFLDVAKDELDKKYYLDCFKYNKDYYLSFAKIKKNQTIFDEIPHLNNHKGIFIDIFPIDNVSDIKKSHTIAGIIKIINDTIFVKLKIRKLKDTRYPLIVRFVKILSIQKLMKIKEKMVKKNKDNNSPYLACFFSLYDFNKELLEREAFLPTKKIKFENKEYQIINGYDNYLKNIYGDYMKLPPKEKRVNHMPEKIDFGEDNED